MFLWKSVEGERGNSLYLCSETEIESIFRVGVYRIRSMYSPIGSSRFTYGQPCIDCIAFGALPVDLRGVRLHTSLFQAR